jgi:hypothetical protein
MRMQYELYEALHKSNNNKKIKAAALMSQLVRKIQRQADTKAGRYKGRQIPEFKVSLVHCESRPMCSRNSKIRAGFHQLVFSSVLNQGRKIFEFFCNVKENVCLMSPKN